MLIELIATTLTDAITIEKAGGDRIELVSALLEGGLTPSAGLITQVTAAVRIPVNVMLRPHSAGFVYSANDMAVMKYDISVINETKANGIVLGVLDANGQIDRKKLEELLPLIKNRPVTFHRAIDDTEDPVAAVKILAAYDEIKVVLTSGGKGEFQKRMDTVIRMKAAAPRLEILVGSGITAQNIGEVHRLTGTGAYHAGTAVRQESSSVLGVEEARAREFVRLAKGLEG